uniref:Secreted protein n=1 Tax=Arundo donax TaxID=35708 RepID=A0A0A9G6C9_ARUDO
MWKRSVFFLSFCSVASLSFLSSPNLSLRTKAEMVRRIEDDDQMSACDFLSHGNGLLRSICAGGRRS